MCIRDRAGCTSVWLSTICSLPCATSALRLPEARIWASGVTLPLSLIHISPAEGLSGKFTRVDRKKFGCLPGITAVSYTHLRLYSEHQLVYKTIVTADYVIIFGY